MASHTAQQIRARIVDFAAHPVFRLIGFAFSGCTFTIAVLIRAAAFFGWCDARFQTLRRFVAGVFHAQRGINVFQCELIQSFAADAPNEFAQHNEIHVRVNELRADFVERRKLPDVLPGFFHALLVIFDVVVGDQA